ncbi:MAG: hypothetical protein HY078_00180 [Elusimicrobia bacterium]|nr:hypothetical protein [Elusimicrobiota bacterium]
MPSGDRARQCLLALAGLALVAYAPSLSGDYVLDDRAFLVANPFVISDAGWTGFFTERRALTSDVQQAAMMYRPLTAVSFRASHLAGGGNPFWHHAVSVVLHAANTGLVFLLLTALCGGGAAPAVAGAALFCLHPAQVESVAYLTGRAGLLALFFGLGSLLLHARGRRLAALAAFSAALLSKESALAVAPMIAAYEWIWGPKDAPPRRGLLRALPYAAAGAVFMACRRAVLGQWAQRPLWGGALDLHASLALRGVFEDARIAAWPARLSVCYSFPYAEHPRLAVVAGVAAAAIAAAAAAYLLWRKRPAGFAAAWFLVGLAPVANVLPLTALAADRFLYEPLVAAALAAALGLRWGLERLERRGRGALLGLAGAGCLVLGSSAIEREQAWQDAFALDLESRVARPNDPCTALRLSAHYLNWSMHGRAEAILREGLAQPASVLEPALLVSSSLIRIKERRWDEAESLLKRAQALEPGRKDAARLLDLCAAGKAGES